MGNPYTIGKGLMVDTDTPATQWLRSQPAATSTTWIVKDKIARHPHFRWLGYGDVAGQLDDYLFGARQANLIAQLSLYGIPDRDLGGESSGGAPDFKSYARWVRTIATKVGEHPTVVVLETDTIIHLESLTQTKQIERLACLNYAVNAFNRSCPNTYVYLDGGDGRWNGPDSVAFWLARAGVAGARGFAINVSNYNTSAQCDSMAAGIHKILRDQYAIGTSHHITDTSRNGNGPDAGGTWCNPAGRKLGLVPAISFSTVERDANLWVKHPGVSDGSCGIGAGTYSGQFVPQLATRLYYGT